jgi:hypothetical protein
LTHWLTYLVSLTLKKDSEHWNGTVTGLGEEAELQEKNIKSFKQIGKQFHGFVNYCTLMSQNSVEQHHRESDCKVLLTPGELDFEVSLTPVS